MKNIFKVISILFVVTLSLFIFGCAESTEPNDKFTVTFKDYDGTILRQEIIQLGHSATAPKDPERYGYIFLGWDSEYTNIQKDTILVAQYERDENIIFEYKVTFIDYDGTILKEEIVQEGSNATPPLNPERDGYNFTGWDNEYFNVNKNLIIKALYEEIKVTIKYTVIFNTNSDSVIENQIVEKGEKITEPQNPIKNGYTFTGWYLNDEKWNFEKYATVEDITLQAKWQVNTYDITYDLKDGITTNPATYTIEDEITLNNPTKEGYIFIGWTSESNLDPQINLTFKNETENKHFNANYTPEKYNLTLDVNGGGLLEKEEIQIEYDSIFAITPQKDGYEFLGWYTENDELVELGPWKQTNDLKLIAKWKLVIKVYEENGRKYVNLGRYPQTVETNETTISALSNISSTNELGYIEYNGNEYKKVFANQIPDSTFINGNSILFLETYYFLVEPIKWRVLGEDDGTYKLLCEMILDNIKFYHTQNKTRTINGETIYADNYEYSNIRAWLNGYDGSNYNVDNYVGIGFYDIAFTKDEKEVINNTLVDNSLESTGDSNNIYICNNTTDKIYLLSVKDLLNANYGFSEDRYEKDEIRCAILTDYVRSKGGRMQTSGSYLGNGSWWLRTPNNGNYFSRIVDYDGYIYTQNLHYSSVGVRPALTITI